MPELTMTRGDSRAFVPPAVAAGFAAAAENTEAYSDRIAEVLR